MTVEWTSCDTMFTCMTTCSARLEAACCLDLLNGSIYIIATENTSSDQAANCAPSADLLEQHEAEQQPAPQEQPPSRDCPACTHERLTGSILETVQLGFGLPDSTSSLHELHGKTYNGAE